MTRVHSIEGYSGGTTPENYGGENDATYLCTPVRIVADTALEAIERATSVGEAMADVADRHPHAAWVTSPAEAAYALMASCVIALGQLPTTDRLAVLMASAVTDDLRGLLDADDKDVVECSCGAVAPANAVLRSSVVEAMDHRAGCPYRRDA
jgi:hypothetical protein